VSSLSEFITSLLVKDVMSDVGNYLGCKNSRVLLYRTLLSLLNIFSFCE
jgi:hypothetical protein